LPNRRNRANLSQGLWLQLDDRRGSQQKGRTLIVYLVCSLESELQRELFTDLAQRLATSVGASVDVRPAVGGPVDANDYEAVEKRFADTLVSCSPSLDRPSGRFQGVFGQGGPCAPDRFTSAIGGL